MRRREPPEIADLLTGTPLIIMLDIDGTLCEIVERPDAALIPHAARASLAALAHSARAGVHLAFVTGRSVADARRMIGLEGVVIYGNHGMERLSDSGTIRGPKGWEEMGPNLRSSALELTQILATIPGTSLEDKQLTLTVHYRGMDMAALPELSNRVGEIARRYGLRASPGKRVINLVPGTAEGKGGAALEFVHDVACDAAAASILFVGDDVTDEDAFRALSSFPDAVTVRVGSTVAESAARYSIDTSGDVHELLALLVASRL